MLLESNKKSFYKRLIPSSSQRLIEKAEPPPWEETGFWKQFTKVKFYKRSSHKKDQTRFYLQYYSLLLKIYEWITQAWLEPFVELFFF